MLPAHIERLGALALAATLPLALASRGADARSVAPRRAAETAQGPRVNPDAKALAEFMAKVNEYVELHRKLESTLPGMLSQTTAEQVDQSQRSLGRLIQQARSGAKQNDLFVKDARKVLRRLLISAFEGPNGKELKETIMEENVGQIRLQVNMRYPDNVPVTTVPPQILQILPKLPAELEYRFLGDRLILFDEHAHLIPDFMNDAVPR